MKPTYKESYDKIIEAYFKDEIKPLNAKFCFCGTLHGDYEWKLESTKNGPYTYNEYGRMELALFSTFPGDINEEMEGYEDKLFAGMSAALDVLKQIHIENGEIIDEAPAFTKRILQSTTTN